MSYVPSSRGTLNAEKKRMVVALFNNGSSQRAAARFVGCSPTTITRTAARDPEFAAAIAHAHQTAEISLLRRIQEAGKSPQFWRASAWLLERMNPDDFVVHPDSVSKDQLKQVIATICEIVCEDLPLAKLNRIQRKLDTMLRESGFRALPDFEHAADLPANDPTIPHYETAHSATATHTTNEVRDTEVNRVAANDSATTTSDDAGQVGQKRDSQSPSH